MKQNNTNHLVFLSLHSFRCWLYSATQFFLLVFHAVGQWQRLESFLRIPLTYGGQVILAACWGLSKGCWLGQLHRASSCDLDSKGKDRSHYIASFPDAHTRRNVLTPTFLKDSLFNLVKWCGAGAGVNKSMKLNKVHNFLFNEIDISN